MTSNFKTDLEEIESKILNIGNGLLEANTLIKNAMSTCDTDMFQEARSHIQNISSKANEIDNAVIKVLALHAPEAKDLRQAIAYLKITNEFIRACTNTRSFIRGFTDVCTDVDVKTINEYAVPMQSSTVQALSLAISIIHCKDPDEIQAIYDDVIIEESKTDDLYEMVERNLSIQADDFNAFDKFHKMLRALRKSGKIASRAISIANLLLYAKLGGNFHN